MKFILLSIAILASLVTNAQCWKMVSCGVSHTAAIKYDGSLWGWGLLPDSAGSRLRPVRIGSDSTWTYVFAGAGSTFAIKEDGSLWGWGDNYYGQLGDTDRSISAAPRQIGADTDWVMIGGYLHCVALKKNGTIWSWGSNTDGQLGDGTKQNRYTPTQVGTESDWREVAAGAWSSYAIKTDGSLWAWGANHHCNLGDGTTSERLSPVRIGNSTNWRTVDGGFDHALGIQTDGTLWAWGSNEYGQSGTGGSFATPVRTPTRVGTASDWVAINAASENSFGLRTNGTIWGWGRNDMGILGTGNYDTAAVPVRIGTDSDWEAISRGSFGCKGIRSGARLWSWGLNGQGDVGDGTTVTKLTPLQISCWPLSLEDVSSSGSAQFRIVPNPVHDRLNIETRAGQKIDAAVVVDLTGRTIVANATDADITDLAPGLYYVQIKSGAGRYVVSFTKQ